MLLLFALDSRSRDRSPSDWCTAHSTRPGSCRS